MNIDTEVVNNYYKLYNKLGCTSAHINNLCKSTGWNECPINKKLNDMSHDISINVIADNTPVLIDLNNKLLVLLNK